MKGMGATLSAMKKSASDSAPLAIYYAFKQSESILDGVTSAGWSSFLQAIADAGLSVDGTWPIRMELTTSLKATVNALSAAVVIVCRKRRDDAPITDRAGLISLLRKELPPAIDAIRKAGVGPVDMQQSVIGPGMGVFSRHAKVLEDDDSSMSVKTALTLINRIWEEIDQELTANFDPETQVALAWFGTYGFEARASGELIVLANAKNIAIDSLFDSGVFQDLRGKTALTPRTDLPNGWTPSKDRHLTVWECTQHAARVLNAEDGGGLAAAKLVAEMGAKADEARALSYRLFEIATQKGWSAEALVYNELAREWPKLEEMGTISARPVKPKQTDLFG
jgi:putative DNA methylase